MNRVRVILQSGYLMYFFNAIEYFSLDFIHSATNGKEKKKLTRI